MIFQFPSTVQRSNSTESESNPSTTRTYHYKRSSTLQATRTPYPFPPNSRDSTSSFGSETADPPTRPKSPPPPPISRIDVPPKSPKRFWAFSTQSPPPLPAMPAHVRSSSTNSVKSGAGVEIIRRPSEAARTMKQKARLDRSGGNAGPGLMALTEVDVSGKDFDKMRIEPNTAPLPSSPYRQGEITRIVPVTAPLRTKSSQTSFKSIKPKNQEETDKRSTIKPAPRTQLPPIPFSHHLISHTTRPALGSESSTIITLTLSFSTDERCKNDSVKLTWEVLKRGGGYLMEVVNSLLGPKSQRSSLDSEKSDPDLTDGSSSEDSELDSEYGLEALLRDEYLQSLMLPDSPDILKHFPPPPPLPESFSVTVPSSNKPRAQKRNQYAQQDKFPSPSSPYTARSHTLPLMLAPAVPRNNRHTLKISTINDVKPVPIQYGTLTEIEILLLRDAAPYHIIAQRLIAGSFVNTSLSSSRDPLIHRKVEEELRWLGMSRLADELGESQQRLAQGPTLKHKKSGVITGGRGYI